MLAVISEFFNINYSLVALDYLLIRSVLAVIIAFVLSLVLGSKFINYLKNRQLGQVVRADGPASHLSKQGTPTMGGILIILVIIAAMLFVGDLHNFWILLLLFIMLSFAGLGWVDDWLKLTKNNSAGLSAKLKLLWQFIFATIFMVLLVNNVVVIEQNILVIPGFQEFSINLGLWLVPFGSLVIVATSNAVNLTDGLDGLVIMPVILVAAGLGVFAYLSGNHDFADYFLVPYLPNMGEVVVFCAAIFGAGLGFLWFNSYPAQVFMGDVGSLSLGAILGAIAVLVRQELLLIIMGFVFVAEALSVIIQVISYRLTGNRVFKMAPLHHHFELSGLAETKIIIRFWIVTLVLVILALVTLKVR